MNGKLAVALCLTAAVGHQPQETRVLFPGIPQPESVPEAGVQLELVQEFGDLDGDLEFGQIVGLAVSDSGILAVLDAYGCQIWIVDTGTGEGTSIGGCGDGPGEFREATAAAFRGDTLFVFDGGRASMVKLTLEGTEIGRFHTNLYAEGAYRIMSLYTGVGSSIHAGLWLFPNNMTRETRQLAAFDSFEGTVSRKGLKAPPVAASTPANVSRSFSFCGTTLDGPGDVLLTVNLWGPQIAIVRGSDFRPLKSVLIPLDWIGTEEDPRLPGHWAPMSPTPRAACGERYAVINYRDQGSGPNGDTEVSEGAVVIYDFQENAMTVLGGDEPPEPGTIFFMTAGAGTGNRFFFYTDSFFGYPVIREYRVAQAER